MKWAVITDQALPSRQVTQLHFIRHGRVDTGGERMAYGELDLPLSEEGLRQTRQIVERVVSQFEDVKGVLSSDLQRTRAIAEPLAARLGVPLLVEPALREQSMGDWEGVPWSELTARYPAEVREFWTDYHRIAPPNGESLGDLSKRVLSFFEAQHPHLAGGRFVVVAHIGVIRAVLCSALGIALKDALRMAPQPSTHTWVLHAESGFVIQCMGERTVELTSGPAEEARVEGEAPQFAEDRAPRVAFSGSAGVGKTTLASAIAEEFGVSYLPEGMRREVELGLDLRLLNHEELKSLVLRLWRQQVDREEACIARGEGFVSDRSPLDYLAFWMTYGFVHNEKESAELAEEVMARIAVYDRIILLPHSVLPLEADGVRSTNRWIQRRFHATVRGLLEEEVGAPRFAQLPRLTHLSERMDWVRDLLTRSGEYAARPTK
ncbi:MAG: histidine phosphatase family protein [Myxococcota bacterium]|nr:histidine phosphatase family protein [Myxococcota bacterium]